MLTRLVPLILLALVAACSRPSAPHDRLNGTWSSDLMTVTFDFRNHKTEGVAMGEQFSHQLELVSEKANLVVYKSGDSTIICQCQEHGDIMITKQGTEGGIPLTLHRSRE